MQLAVTKHTARCADALGTSAPVSMWSHSVRTGTVRQHVCTLKCTHACACMFGTTLLDLNLKPPVVLSLHAPQTNGIIVHEDIGINCDAPTHALARAFTHALAQALTYTKTKQSKAKKSKAKQSKA